MKKIALVCALAGFASMASADWCDWCFQPYVGLDAQGRHVEFDDRFGDNLFKHDYPQGNAYFGFKFNEYLGLEGGYEWTKRMHRQVSLGSSDFTLGNNVGNGAPVRQIGKAKFDGWHANLVGFLPITDDCCTELFASVGVVQLRSTFERISTGDNLGIVDPAVSSSFRDTRTVARANLGVQAKIVDAFGIRATIGWENTSKIRPYSNSIDVLPNTQVKMKDSFIYGIGINYTFC